MRQVERTGDAAASIAAPVEPPAPAWGRAAAQQQQGRDAGRSAPEQATVPDQATPAAYNAFAKFSAIGDAAPLWRAAAEALSQYAAQVPPLALAFLIAGLWAAASPDNNTPHTCAACAHAMSCLHLFSMLPTNVG